jgi:hypothetical protein
MSAMLIDSHIGDFDIAGAIRPFSDVQDADQIIAADESDLILPGADEPEVIFTVNGDVLFIAARLEEHRVALGSRIDSVLNGREISAPVQGNDNCARPRRRSAPRGDGREG